MDYAIYIIPALIIVIGYFWYVSIITKRNKALEALSGVDVQLTKRSNLIPNIIALAQKFMEHEKALFAEITALRSKATESYNPKDAKQVKQHLESAGTLQSKMADLMIAVENYPQLKSDTTMVNAQQSYNEVEAQISAARRFYNSAVTDFNNAIQIFPGSLIARLMALKDLPFYEATEQQKQRVDVKDAW